MNHRKPQLLIIVAGLLLVVIALASAYGPTPTLAQDPTQTPNPVGDPPTFLSNYYDAWVESPHANVEAEAFVHWDEDGEVSERCAACHTSSGYVDFLGGDGTEAGVVDAPHPIGQVVNCDACHNPTAARLTNVSFPSGLEVNDIGDSTRCMVCHQGRASGLDVDAAILDLGLEGDLDTVSADLRFINQHYYAAAATLYGSEVNGGYQYDGMTYQMKFNHVEGVDTCDDCHNPHTLEVRVNTCTQCHGDLESAEDLLAIRAQGSLIDYDGDGDISEGIYYELETLKGLLWDSIYAYSVEVVGSPIGQGGGYPYFFNDTNGDGMIDETEGVRDNAYSQFTPRLLQAVYNYQVISKDPGGFAHNAKYHIELMVDSIMSLNSALDTPIDGIAQVHRDDPGHFDSSAEAFRHWDEDGEVSGSCATCHTAEGLPFYLEHGVSIAREPADELSCETCHNVDDGFAIYTLNEVEMPSGATVSFGEEDPNNICLHCHQGRESSVSVQTLIDNSGAGDDEVSEALRFRNPHYFAAGATLFGAEANGAYEFDGMEYQEFAIHAREANTCTECHDTHALEIRVNECMECHENLEDNPDLRTIRLDDFDDPIDYDGDGDVTEGVAAEIETLHDALFVEIQAYAAETVGTPLLYVPSRYPYFYVDTNGNGEADPDEIDRANGFGEWTPTLVRAIYNYLWVDKDPGSFAHNPDYILQILYDTLMDIGGEDAVSSFERAPVR